METKPEFLKRTQRDEMEIDSVGNKKLCEIGAGTEIAFEQTTIEQGSSQQAAEADPAMQDRWPL